MAMEGGFMFGCILSGGVHGIDAFIVRVETDISDGFPGIDLVGFLGNEVREARERVWTAVKNSGFEIPQKKVTINLSPANIRKHGTGYDLAMALGLLRATQNIKSFDAESTICCGELMLSGDIGGIRGILPIVKMAKEQGIKRCIIPKDNAKEGAVIDGIDIIAVETLREVIDYLNGDLVIEPEPVIREEIFGRCGKSAVDLKDVQGQQEAKRGLEIGAAGLHNILMVGPPGTGKTMLSRCLSGILPGLSLDECLEVSSVYSVAGLLNKEKTLITERPFISPHHTATPVTMTGGGNSPKPGMIALAHRGVLFLDEMPEFEKRALEVLRQPLEDKVIHVARNNYMCDYPADFMLVGALNPCPCGMYPNMQKCTCTDAQRKHYIGKISKPLLDRMDICMNVLRPDTRNILYKKTEESSEAVRKRVIMAQNVQRERFKGLPIMFNSQMGINELEMFCSLGSEELAFMEKAFKKYELSARGYHRILKTARTIADLDQSEQITIEHLMEAIFFRVDIE